MDNIIIWNDLFLYPKYSIVDDEGMKLLFEECFSSAEKNVEYIDCITAKRWANNLNPDCGIAIGSRPSKLFPALEMITTRRLKNEDGHTVSVSIDKESAKAIKRYIENSDRATIDIYEDAIVEGKTIEKLIEYIREKTSKTIKVFTLFALSKSIGEIEKHYDNVCFSAFKTIPGIPIKESTILFLSDLINRDYHKTIPFIENDNLMIPCFGDKYCELRDGIYKMVNAARGGEKVVLLNMENDKANYFYLLKCLLIAYQMIPEGNKAFVHFGQNARNRIRSNVDIFDIAFQQETQYEFPSMVIRESDCIVGNEYGYYDQESLINNSLAVILKDKIHFKEDIFLKIDSEITSLFGDYIVLGCHVRHGLNIDFCGHPRGIDIEALLSIIEEMYASGNFDKVFITTDNSVLIDEAKQRFGNDLLSFDSLKNASFDRPVEVYSKEEDRCKLIIIECLRDMIALSRCAEMLTDCSELSHLALLYKLSRNERYKKIVLMDKDIRGGGLGWQEYKKTDQNKKTRKCLFVSDLDGTLVQNEIISDEELSNWKALMASGVPVTIATARSKNGMIKCMRGYIPTLPTIHYNGALIFDHYLQKAIYTKTFESECLYELLQQISRRSEKIMIVYLKHDLDYALKVDIHEMSITKLISEFKNCIAVYEFTDKSPTAGRFRGYHYTSFNEYTPCDAEKGTAVKWLVKQLGFKSIFAVGDSDNDFSLFEVADQYCHCNTNRGFNNVNPYDEIWKRWDLINESM